MLNLQKTNRPPDNSNSLKEKPVKQKDNNVNETANKEDDKRQQHITHIVREIVKCPLSTMHTKIYFNS